MNVGELARAESLGILAKNALSRSSPVVVEAFRDSLYLRSDEMVILSRTARPSPISVIVEADLEMNRAARAGERASWSDGLLNVGDLWVDCRGTALYRQKAHLLPADIHANLRRLARGLVNSAFALGRFYDTVELANPPPIVNMPLFTEFVDKALLPFSRGASGGLLLQPGFLRLVGAGPGFTPAGDDFLGGFTLIHNALCTATGLSPILLPEAVVTERTTWVSAMFLRYAQRGVVDEGLSSLLESVLSGSADSLTDSVVELSTRGHTSGLDVSLGAILGAATSLDCLTGGRLLDEVLRRLR